MSKSDFKTLSLLDSLVIHFDQGIRSLAGTPIGTGRSNPSQAMRNNPLSKKEEKHAAALMRINQTGEIAAQALYQGQALTASNLEIRDIMQKAAVEENDHLLWCNERVQELKSHQSVFNPLWYLASLSLGLLAGALGDKWSLGFLAETEKQVGNHLQKHLDQLPANDHKSRAIVAQMFIDETEHANMAIEQGANPLPNPIKIIMKLSAKIMTKVVYYI